MISRTTEDESLPLPPPQGATPPPATSTPPSSEKSALDKFGAVASGIGNAIQQGLSYANARRARETYRG